jgi:putative endonuclease
LKTKETPIHLPEKFYCHNLIYYEHYIDINQAIARETELKKWSRAKKNALIASTNPDWKFLNDEVNND